MMMMMTPKAERDDRDNEENPEHVPNDQPIPSQYPDKDPEPIEDPDKTKNAPVKEPKRDPKIRVLNVPL